MKYDALLLVSFGGPEHAEDVIPFLENVLRGRNVPRRRLLEVAEHYYHLGGRSPINDQCRDLIAALRLVVDLPIYWGNRSWDPLLPDTLRQMKEDGVCRALAIAASAYSSYSACRQYIENIAAACPDGLVVVVVAPIGFLSDHMEALYDLDEEAASLARDLGLHFVRAQTVGTHPAMIAMPKELIEERLHAEAPSLCAEGCCPPTLSSRAL